MLFGFFLAVWFAIHVLAFASKPSGIKKLVVVLIILNVVVYFFLGGRRIIKSFQDFTSIEVSNNGSWSLRNAFGVPIGYIGLADELEVHYLSGSYIYSGRSYQKATYHFVEIRVGDKKYRSSNNDLKSLEKAMKEMGAIHRNNLIAMKNNMIARDPTIYSLAYRNRGLAYFHKGQDDMAVKDFNMAIALNPNDSLAYFNRGEVYFVKGDMEKTRADYQKACELGYEKACENFKSNVYE